MKIIKLKINGLRNLSSVNFQPVSGFNLFCGMNGSGKSSLLESIYLLGFGRSFRAPQINTLIHYQESALSTFVEAADHYENHYLIGLEKNRNKNLHLKINGERAKNRSQVADLFPVQIICPDSFQLLTAGPEGRRQFLDWGVFHVEHSFFTFWSQYTQVLRQRNSVLRQKNFISAHVKAWDNELVSFGEALTVYRKQYISQFVEKLRALLACLLPELTFELIFYQGWDPEKTLKQALEDAIAGDMKVGFTRVGPQRADLICMSNQLLAGQTLSRGQQKLFVCAMILAQGQLILEAAGKQCIYLIDDLAAELDRYTRRRVIECLAASGSQVFMTGIEADFLKEGIQGFEHKMFHVEHGEITPQ